MKDGYLALYVDEIPATPGPCTSPNSRCHYQKKAKAVRELRETARLAAVHAINSGKRAKPLPETGPIALHWTVFLGRRERERDFTNIGGCLKAAEDGIFDALGTDDRRVVEVRIDQLRAQDGRGWMQCAVIALEGDE